MSDIPLYQEMRQKAGPLWQAIFEHAFVKGIGDGSLSRDRFEFYLKQVIERNTGIGSTSRAPASSTCFST